MTRRRCVRGHFIPATASTDSCRCTLRRPIHPYAVADLGGQGLPEGRTIRTIALTGSYL
ncbi:hypothetical protein [Streptomyces sp. MNP-20]|uniref:hypothetical protein n=1 Tax=Streptomyces sp. MNP-20 TaxID=2721165 RepID=UPI0015528493|nr:hypothetical protein [Streptomyces sp. MNP-20]